MNTNQKRRFYEDDENVTPIPGTVVMASETEVQSLRPLKLVDGVSVRSPKQLEDAVRSVREAVVGLLQKTESGATKASEEYYEVEHKVTGTVAALHDKKEDLLPAGLYILTGMLTGSIVTRRRGLFLRFMGPFVFALGTFKWALPVTFANTMSFAHAVERENVPAVAEAQDKVVAGLKQSVRSAEKAVLSAQQTADVAIESLKNTIASLTGLNIGGEPKK